MAFMHSVIAAGVLALKWTPVATGKSTERQGQGEEEDGPKNGLCAGFQWGQNPRPFACGADIPPLSYTPSPTNNTKDDLVEGKIATITWPVSTCGTQQPGQGRLVMCQDPGRTSSDVSFLLHISFI